MTSSCCRSHALYIFLSFKCCFYIASLLSCYFFPNHSVLSLVSLHKSLFLSITFLALSTVGFFLHQGEVSSSPWYPTPTAADLIPRPLSCRKVRCATNEPSPVFMSFSLSRLSFKIFLLVCLSIYLILSITVLLSGHHVLS